MSRRGSSKRHGRTILATMLACGSLAATIAEHEALGSVDKDLHEAPVVMIVLDELPIATLMDESGAIDKDLFPNFARLVGDSTWFRNTTTPALFTREAVPAILTGLYPTNGQRNRPSVFSLVSGNYDIPLKHEHGLVEPSRGAGRERSQVRGTCPSSACQSASPPATKLERRYGHLFRGMWGGEFLRFLSVIRGDNEPRFYFLHYVMPHQPWIYFPTGQSYNEVTSLPGEIDVPGPAEGWNEDEWLITQAYQRHLLQTALVDRQLGVLIERLEAREIYERSLIVITADHGIAFEPGASKRIVTPETEGQISAVPFFIKEPFQNEGRISDLPLETIDVVPTLMDALSPSATSLDTDGVSAFSSDFPTGRIRETDGMVVSHNIPTRFEAAAMKYELFGRTGGGLDLFELGPGETRHFVGKGLTHFDVIAASDTNVTIEKVKRIETATPRKAVLPAFLQGALAGSRTQRHKVVIALNGRVAAVTKSYPDPRDASRARFFALLPPDSFGLPPNDLDLYLVEDAATRTLAPLVEGDPEID